MVTELLLVIAVSVVATAAYPMQSYHIFMGCYDPICNMNGIYGFHCKNGICSYICSEVGCRHDGLMRRPKMGESNLIFYGCKGVSCAVNGFYGYGCIAGVCHYICSDSGCVDVKWVKRGSKCPSEVVQKEVQKDSKVENKVPTEANVMIVQNNAEKEVEMEELSSTETDIGNADLVANESKEEEEVTDKEEVEDASPAKRSVEEPTESKEASGKENVSIDTSDEVETIKSSVEEISENKKTAVAPSKRGSERKSSRKAPRKKRLPRGPKPKQDQSSGEQIDVNRPPDFSL